jgi:hypothetical protein
MFRTIRVGAELQKVARGQKTKLGIENLAALVLEMGREAKKRKPRKRQDIAFLETLYRLEDTRA